MEIPKLAVVCALLLAMGLAAGYGLRMTGNPPALSPVTDTSSTGHSFTTSTYAGSTGSSSATNCTRPLGASAILKSTISYRTFDLVTEFTLPSPLRDPNSIAAAPDGSVWFGEQSVPGFGHLFPNGTLVEYAWPYSYPAQRSSGSICSVRTYIDGVAVLNGKIWATDAEGNRIVSMNPSTGLFAAVALPGNDSYPYTLTPGPNSSLWFPERDTSKIGVLDASNGTFHEFAIPSGQDGALSEIVFPNATVGYYAEPGNAGGSHGGIYSFDPRDFSPKLVGGRGLNLPTSVAFTPNTMWVALHSSSDIASYSFLTKSWFTYPTSYIDYAYTTLPYFLKSNGSVIWLNEHFGNRIAVLDPTHGSLIEYGISNPPATDLSKIGNALTFTVWHNRVWFTAWTGNIIGFVDASSKPSFSTSIEENSSTITLRRGTSTTIGLRVLGQSGNYSLRFSDSETSSSVPNELNFTAPNQVSVRNGEGDIDVSVTASSSLAPGTYVALFTATDGLIYSSAIVKIVVLTG